MIKKIFIVIAVFILLKLLFSFGKSESENKRVTLWEFQSIDTMKYSRDVAQEKLNDLTYDEIIKQQVEDIAATGATHIGIATPYDEEFYPFLKRWVNEARRNNLNVWFRGNWSGWEKWFEYEKIDRKKHIEKTRNFILNNPGLFVDGDVFSACPECENGGPGDPRQNGDIEGHRKFLVDEYKVTKNAFQAIGKDVDSNYNSMNGDVARIIMDSATTHALDGIVTIDHYVSSPEKLADDIKSISKSSGGKIVLGEFGVPIPDINGKMSEQEQSDWINKALLKLSEMPEVVGISYWVNTGSSTALWSEDGAERKAVEILRSAFKAPIARVIVKDSSGSIVKNANLNLNGRHYVSDNNGVFNIPYFNNSKNVEIRAEGYFSKKILLARSDGVIVILKKENEDLVFKLNKFIQDLF